MATRFGLPRSQAKRDVDQVFEQWISEGLFSKIEIGSSRRVNDHRSLPTPNSELSWTVALGSACISINADHDVGDLLRPWLTHLEPRLGSTENCQSMVTATIGAFRSFDGELALLIDGRERFRTSDFAVLAGGIFQSIIELSQPATTLLAWMHGAAVATKGKAIALPAPSGSGKSTLIAHLIKHNFMMLTDDMIGLSDLNDEVVPWPMPISLKQGSWDLLTPDLPELATVPVRNLRGKTERLFMPGPKHWCERPLPLKAICFPRYEAGASTNFARLTPLDALQRLLEDRCHLGYPLSVEGLRAFLAVLARVPAFALRYSRLEDAQGCLDTLPLS